MAGKLKVGYQNVYNSHINTHAFLDWRKAEGVEVAFMGEAWINREGIEIQMHSMYKVGSGVRKGKRVIVYYWHGLEILITKDKDDISMAEVGGGKIARVYIT